MSNEEVEKVLKELEDVRPEKLNDKAKRLFEAIMKICDQRDIYKNELIKLGIKTEIKNKDVEEIWKDIKGYTFKYIELEEIINERDKAEADLYEANNRINDLLDIVEHKHEVIELMAEQLTTPIHDKEWVIKYFEERCK